MMPTYLVPVCSSYGLLYHDYCKCSNFHYSAARACHLIETREVFLQTPRKKLGIVDRHSEAIPGNFKFKVMFLALKKAV